MLNGVAEVKEDFLWLFFSVDSDENLPEFALYNSLYFQKEFTYTEVPVLLEPVLDDWLTMFWQLH